MEMMERHTFYCYENFISENFNYIQRQREWYNKPSSLRFNRY